MTNKLQIKFDPNQDYQIEAVESVVGLFEGLPERTVEFSLGDEIVPNLPPDEVLSDYLLEDNLRAVQEKNALNTSLLDIDLQVDDGLVLKGTGDESWRYPHFTVEMETGTGKTYVYLRTIYELRKHFGFTKFIIIVPSIAIFEGVVKNFEITRDHFRALFGNEITNLTRYDGSQLSRLRSFATSTFTEIMVMTLDAFNKKSNNIYKASEKLPGERKPYQFIQETHPILILDEPQNMESETSREALRTLHPLFALRYSATHKSSPNLIYRLTPFDAYRRNLVKKIQVYGVTERDNFNQPFLALEAVSVRSGISASVKTYISEKGSTREATVTLKHGDDLYAKTHREEHRDGYQVTEINAAANYVEFANGLKLALNDTIGPSRPAIFRTQIERTIEQHMEMQERLRPLGVKVLSLFFIDRVANYVDENGLIKRIFDESFNKIKRRFAAFEQLRPDQVREAYFAKSKTKANEEQDVDTDNKPAEREAEKAAFELIMRRKERLLSFDEPVSFIFAHSALKEGWDNPNVFQICTLNQTVSPIKKRQEIGRGLRLCVNQQGDRLFGDDVNILTVIANESYRSYAEGLQQEYTADGDMAPPQPSDARRKMAIRNDTIFHNNAEFKWFWNNLSRRVTYRVNVDTDALVEACIERLNAQSFPSPVLVVEKGEFVMSRYTFTLESVSHQKARIKIEIVNTNGESTTVVRDFKPKDDLSRILGDERLRRFKVVSIDNDGHNSSVCFEDIEIRLNKPYLFESEGGQKPRERASLAPEEQYPVFNLLDRAARETGLTRPTVNAIFKRLRDTKKAMLLKNPEGFAGVFISEIKNALATHVADRIEFVVDNTSFDHDLDDLFPPRRSFPQKELIDAGDNSLYDQVQTDSGEEEKFVAQLNRDGNVLFFFKFPPAFKIHFPKIIGNYNPDWGIARYADDGKMVLQLVRETKGTLVLEDLRFRSEQRKIVCAQKHFDVLGFDYRHVRGDTKAWWKSRDDVGTQDQLDI